MQVIPECIVLDKPDLEALEVHTQVFAENLLKRSVRLDIVAMDSAGTKHNVGIQRADKGGGRSPRSAAVPE